MLDKKIKYTRSWINNWEGFIFFLMILVHLVLIWVFPYIPTQDGPSHLNNANVIKEYGSQNHQIFREYLTLNKTTLSNWIGHLMLAGLMSIFPILIAEKIFLSGYVIMLPMFARYAICSVKPEASALSFLIFPFIYNFTFHMGFYNFSYSLPLFFLLIGYWIRHSEKFGLREAVVMAFLSTLLILFHIMTFLLTCIFIGILLLSQIVMEYRCIPSDSKFSWKNSLRILFSRTLFLSFSLLPAIVFASLFFRGQGVESSGWNFRVSSFSLGSLSSFGENEEIVYILFGIFILVLFALLKSNLSSLLKLKSYLFVLDLRLNRYILVLAVYAFVYLVAPTKMSGGGYIHPRLILFVYFALILCMASLDLTKNIKQATIIVSVLASSLLFVFHSAKYYEINKYLDEYMSASHLIRPGTVVLPICFSRRGQSADHRALSYKVSPFLHATGYIAAEKGLIDLTNYEADYNYFPTKFRKNLNPYLHIGDSEALRGQIDFLTYPQRTGGKVDYVLLWGETDEKASPDVIHSIYKQLEKGYEIIYTSEYKNMRLYKNKSLLLPRGVKEP